MNHSSAAEHLGEWLPQELAAEIRGLLADSPAALSPRLSAWLACEANERGPHTDDRQRVHKRRLSEDGGAGLQLWSSHAAVAPDGQTHEGTSKWGASEEWMSRVFALLDEPESLKNSRLVSQGWAKQIISMKASISVTWKMLNGQEEEKQKELLQRLDGLSRTIGRNRLSGLEALELKDSQLSRRDSSISFASLLTAACGGCPLLRTLKLELWGMNNEDAVALQPLLPRLQTLRLSGLFDRCVDTSKIKGLLSSMSSMTDLHLDCWLDCGYGVVKCIPGELLAVLPQGLARLSIAKVEIDSIDLRDLSCSKTLTDLTIKQCHFMTSMGLSSLVNLKSLSILESVTREGDLEDILATLSKLEHLCIEMDGDDFPSESSATAFVQRLQDSLPLLTSLELKSLCEYNEGILVALCQLTGLTSLNLGQTFVRNEDDEIIPLPPQALRHLTTLKALKHLSLNGLDLSDQEAEEFLDIALPFLLCLPSLESLYVKGLKVTELNAPLFPVQLKTLGISSHGLPVGRETQTAALVAVAARCPGLTSIIYDSRYLERLWFQSLAAVHQKAPNLQFDLRSWIQSPVDYDKDVLRMMASLRDSLIRARPFLQLLERSVPWNTPKHPWNLHKSAEPWVAAARNVIGLCREIAAGEYVS